jgi:hypothetical protein
MYPAEFKALDDCISYLEDLVKMPYGHSVTIGLAVKKARKALDNIPVQQVKRKKL